MNTLTVKASDISCGHCVHTIQSEVGEVAGVKNVVANEQTKLVTITYDQPATEQQIKELLAEIGYPAEAA
jgi:copper chaperone